MIILGINFKNILGLVCDPVAGFMMLELLINMKRVADHSKNISQLVQGTF